MTPAQAATNALVILLALIGAVFFLAGTLGMLRFPDFYSRTHAATKCDTVGAGAMLLAMAVLNGADVSSLKILALGVLILLSSPTGGHAITRAAHLSGVRPWQTPQQGGPG